MSRHFDKAYLDKGILSLQFKPDLLEKEYLLYIHKKYGLDNARWRSKLNLVIYPINLILNFFLNGEDYIIPCLALILNSINSLVGHLWIISNPLYANGAVLYQNFAVLLTSGFIAKDFFPMEYIFWNVTSFYGLTGGSFTLTNFLVALGLAIRLIVDYESGMEYYYFWVIILFLLGIWSWVAAYSDESITREWFYMSKEKDREQAMLLAKQNSRTMFDLISIGNSGKIKLVKKDLLTNKVSDVIRDDSFNHESGDFDDIGVNFEDISEDKLDNSANDNFKTSGSSRSTPLPTEYSQSDELDLWIQGSRPTLRRVLVVATIFYLGISMMNWYLVPTEFHPQLRTFYAYFAIPFCLNLIALLYLSNVLSTYRRYVFLLGVLIFLSSLASWAEIFAISSFGVTESATKILISRLFLYFFIRHNFVFMPRFLRIATTTFDLFGYLLIHILGYIEISDDFGYQLLIIFLDPYLIDYQSKEIWKNIGEIRRYVRKIDILNKEIQSEIDALDDLKIAYHKSTMNDSDIAIEVDSLQKVESPEDWTITLLNRDKKDNTYQFIEIIKNVGLWNNLSIEDKSFRTMVTRILHLYRENPYHNANHALTVCYVMQYFIYHGGALEYFTDLECLSLLIAGLGHDVGHPGQNNAFLIQTGSPLLKIFGPNSLLERYHEHTTIKILGNMPYLPYIDDDEVVSLKKIVSKSILATDTATFAKTLSKFKRDASERGALSSFKKGGTADERGKQKFKIALAKMMMACADVSNVAYSPSMSDMWLVSLLKEFYLQGDLERNVGLPVSMFMDRTKNQPFTLSCGFIDMVAGKMIRELAKVLKIDDFVSQMENNRKVNGSKKAAEVAQIKED